MWGRRDRRYYEEEYIASKGYSPVKLEYLLAVNIHKTDGASFLQNNSGEVMNLKKINDLQRNIDALLLAPKWVQESVLSGKKPDELDTKTWIILRNTYKEIKNSAREVAEVVGMPTVFALGVLTGLPFKKRRKK